jgi:hypothetical protein
MSGRRSKLKGYRNENGLVNFFRGIGIKAERCPLSGGAQGRFKGFDLIVPLFGREMKVETKHYANGFQTLYKWLSPPTVDMLIVRADHSKPLVVIPLVDFIALQNAAKLEEVTK